jgi:hypothetical protein
MHPSKKTIRSKGSCKLRFIQVYNTIPKSMEWLIVNYVVNVTRTTLPRFYIFREKKIRNDYI